MKTTLSFLRLTFRYIGVWFFSFLLSGCNNQVKPPEEKAPPAPVSAEKAEEEGITETVDLFGSIQPLPNQVAPITANVSAPVVSILKDGQGRPLVEGQRVKEGDVIVQLYDKNIKEQRIQADADVGVAKRKVEQLEQIKKETPKAFSQFEMDNAKLALTIAESKVRAMDELLKLYTIRAPISGRLGRIRVQPGQALNSGTVVADVINLENEVDALCFVPPHVARKLHLHQSAVLGTHENEGPDGEVVFIAQQAESDTGLIAVKVRFPNHATFFWQRDWRANTPVHVQVATQSRPKTWVIPAEALMEDQDPPAVIVVQDLKTEKNKEGKEEKLGKAQILTAEIGLRDHEHVELLSLKSREKKELVPIEETWFIIKGGHGLHDDDPVKIEEEEKQSDKEKEKEKKSDPEKAQKKQKD